MIRCLPLLLCVIAFSAVAGEPEKLGRFEQESLDQVLKEAKLEIHPEPAGKRVRKVRVINLEVFSQRDGFLRWFNIFHVTSDEQIVAQEVLLKGGDLFDQSLVDETIRRLKVPTLSNVVVAVAVKTPDPNQVDLLVVTRDVWSLRLNSNFQIQGDEITLLTISLAENNFLGLRKQMAVTFNMGQGSYDIGPRYTDSNVAGTRMTLGAAAAMIFNRNTGKHEGTASSLSLAYPLWSLSRTMGGGISFAHYDGVYRRFQGTNLLPYDLRSTARIESIPYEYRSRSFGISTYTVHSVGTKVKHHFRYGYEFSMSEAEALPGQFDDAIEQERFENEILTPRTERSAGVWVGYRLFTPRFGKYRDLVTYDLREDYRLGPEFDTWIVSALRVLGSNTNHQRMAASASWAFDAGMNSYLKLGASWHARHQNRALVDQSVSTRFYGASPSINGWFRIVGRAGLNLRIADSRNGFYSLGGDNGLRGYAIGQFTGKHRVRGNIELRSAPIALSFLRLGGVAFWDTGHTAESLSDIRLRHDIGVGFRLLIPQVNTHVLRVDWAFAFQGITAGWPGRITVGFFQVF
ncbi:MAG TPA: hypothetical protein EYN06_04010 [Myxococcales bacterium]|nr:hypothetical protein [Myxococcales bacterium]HIN85625.1 hypothetical protein [Myxococcales bacterium]